MRKGRKEREGGDVCVDLSLVHKGRVAISFSIAGVVGG